MRIAFFGTHPNQFNGYSKVVYELCKTLKDVDLHIFGFQNFHDHPGHRKDVPAHVKVFDALASENPRGAGFGVGAAKDYVTRLQPDVVIIFNDLLVLTSILNEVRQAPNRQSFKIIAYIDQVYLCQRKDLLAMVNEYADSAMTFTPGWCECIKRQSLKLPVYPLPHGFNSSTYFPIPKKLARKFFGLPEDDFLILNLNRNQPRKRWDTCLQAFADVVSRAPDAPIKMVVGTALTGAWNLIDLFEMELQKRGVSPDKAKGRLVIPGHPQMLTDAETNFLYNVADIGINTCDGEGFGLCNFEQAAIGIPQIVPALGGFLHFFDESNAIMIKPKLSIYVDSMRDGVGGEAEISAASDFADAIMKYYETPELMKSHGQAARQKILKEFQWKDIASAMMDIVNKTIGQQSPVNSIAPVTPEVVDVNIDKDDSQLAKLESIMNDSVDTSQPQPSEEDAITDIGKRINMLILKNRK